MLRKILFFAWLVPQLILIGLIFLPEEHEHDYPDLKDNLLLMALGFMVCYFAAEYVAYCRRTRRPAWLTFGWASAFFVAIGVPLFASGSIAKHAMEWEKGRWMGGFMFSGIGIVLLLLSVACFLGGRFTRSRAWAHRRAD